MTNLAGFPYWKSYRYNSNKLGGEERLCFCGHAHSPHKNLRPPTEGEGMPVMCPLTELPTSRIPSQSRQRHGGRGQLELAEVFVFFPFLSSAHRQLLANSAGAWPCDMTSHRVAPVKYAARPRSTRLKLCWILTDLPVSSAPGRPASKVSLREDPYQRQSYTERNVCVETWRLQLASI